MSPVISKGAMKFLSITNQELKQAEEIAARTIRTNQRRMFVMCITAEQAEEIAKNQNVAISAYSVHSANGGKKWLIKQKGGQVFGPNRDRYVDVSYTGQ